jgi:predicted ArsR family transcriptional regulator
MVNVAAPGIADTRQLILTSLKRHGPITIRFIAQRLGLTHEAVRQHVVELVRQGWVERCKPRRRPTKQSGRPSARYCLSVAGDHFFPKHYDVLTLDLLEAISRSFGERAVFRVLAAMADATVEQWKESIRGKSFARKLEVLREQYSKLNRSVIIDTGDGRSRLIERNCPFLNVALARPEICSVTVNVLTRLLGFKVIRTERYQNGDGRCVFRVLQDQPSRLTRFELEPTLPH